MSKALLSLSAICERVEELAGHIGAPRVAVTYGGFPAGDATPLILVDSQYHYVISERGVESDRLSTTDLDSLLYRIFEDVTFGMATRYEARHRRPREDSRRQWFQLQEDLLAKLSPAWAARKQREHTEILRGYPFLDN